MVDTPTVFVIDDEVQVREMLGTLIGSAALHVETYADPRTFLDVLDGERSGCIVADLFMPEMSGLELQRRLVERGCLLPFVFLSGRGDVRSAVEALKIGAVDFIEKPFEAARLLGAVREAIHRNVALRAAQAERTAALTRLARLTAREREVLALLVAGRSNKVIAARLGISDNTVENHRASVMKKTEASHVAELVRLVLVADSGPPVV